MRNKYELPDDVIDDIAEWCNDNALSFQASKDLNIMIDKITDDVNIRETTADNLLLCDISKVLSRTECEINGNDDGRFLEIEEIYELRIREIAMIVNMYYGTD